MKRYSLPMFSVAAFLATSFVASSAHLIQGNRIWINVANNSHKVDREINYGNDRIDVIDLKTKKVVQSVKIPKPTDRVFTPDGSRVFITSVTSEHNLFVVDTKSATVIGKILMSGRPNRPTISKDGKKVYVAIRDPGPPTPIAKVPLEVVDYNFDDKSRWAKNGGAIDIIDVATMKVIKSVKTSTPLHNCWITPDNKHVVCDSPEGQNVVVLDTKTETVAWETPVHGPPSDSKVFRHGDAQSMSVEAGPDGSTNRITVEIRGLRGFAVIDFKKRQQVGIVRFPDKPNGFISNADEPHVHGDVVTPDGKARWVASQDSNAFFIYSIPDDKLLGYAPMPEFKAADHPAFKAAGHNNPLIGCNTGDLDFTDDGKLVYGVCEPGFGIAPFVYAVDVATRKVVDRIPLEKESAGDPRALSTPVKGK
jgi:hypothetical protein